MSTQEDTESPGSDRTSVLRRVEWLASVRRRVTASLEIPRLARIGRQDFLERFYAAQRPVVLTDIMKDWPALTRWTRDGLKSRFGAVQVKAAFERNAHPSDYDRKTAVLSRDVPFGELVDRAFTERGNDFYLVAQNNALSYAGLRPLLEDVRFEPELLDPARLDNTVYLWLGPAGTVTPLHHDSTNILFHQVVGTKRFKLIDPCHTELLADTVGYYSRIDPEAPDMSRFPYFRDVRVHDVTLMAGEALFIPAGFWHHVRSDEPAISVSMINFVFPNQFEDTNPLSPKYDAAAKPPSRTRLLSVAPQRSQDASALQR
jgi:ribosomal protein L16 Arg81 hydroxylase